MSTGVNKVILIGHLGADLEIRYTQGGQAVGEMRLATAEQWKDKDGQRQERTEWHRIVMWGPLAENCGKYLSKGRQVYVEGRIQTRSYDDKEGQKKYITEIVAAEVKFLGGGEGRGRGEGRDQQPASSGGGYGGYGGGPPDDGIPYATSSITAEPSAIARAHRSEI